MRCGAPCGGGARRALVGEAVRNNPEKLKKLARVLEQDPALSLELVNELNHPSRIRLANAVLDIESKTGATYSDYLSRTHRRKIMMREISLSMGSREPSIGQIDGNGDGRVSREELEQFLDNMTKHEDASGGGASKAPPAPSSLQLRQFFLLASIPYIAFGFFDNFTMLVFGDGIDQHFGRLLGISTLVAVGLGNWCSDLVGLLLGGYIETITKRFGVTDPKLTLAQLKSRGVRVVQVVAMSAGITLGCFLGMVPILWIDPDAKTYQAMYDELSRAHPSPRKRHLKEWIDASTSVLGGHNAAVIAKRLDEHFPDPEAPVSLDAFRRFVVALRTGKELTALSSQDHFAKQFAEAVGCWRE